MTNISLNGITFTLGTSAEFRSKLTTLLDEPAFHRIATVNPEFMVTAYHDPSFRALLLKSDLITADGAGIILMAKMRGCHARMNQRMTGVDLTHLLLRIAEQQHNHVVIILPSNALSTPPQIGSRLHDLYPNLQHTILYENQAGIVESLRSLNCPIVFVALGAPRQEQWIDNVASHIQSIRIAVGVGGTFDFISGTIHRAPLIWQRVGCEWLWRLMQEPKRVRRILRATIIFPYLFLMKR